MRINVPSFVQTERKNKFIDGFKGVDYSSSPVNIKPYRAAQIKNLVLTDGVLHKRNGWEEFFCPPYETENIVDVISAFDGLFIATFAVPDTIRVYYFKDGETETLLETTSLKHGGLTGRFVKKENEIYFLSNYGKLFTIYRQGDDISLSEIVSAYTPVVSINGGPGEENKRERLDDINLLDVREITYNFVMGEIVEYVSPVMEKLHYNSSTDYSKNYGLYNEIGSAPFEPAELIGIELTSDFFISSFREELVSDHFTVTLEIVNDNGKTVSCVSRKVLTNNVDLIPKQVYISDVATFNRAIKVADIYSKTNKIFEEFKADFMSIKAENEELRIAIDRLIKIKSKASDAAVLLVGQDNAAVKNGTAAKIAEVLNDEQND